MKFINQVEPLITDADRGAVNDYLSSGGWLTEHKHTREFEERLATFLGVKYASLVPNGTIGLYVALRSLGIGPGHYVAIPAYTMVATINAVIWAGAIPILVDINPLNGCMELDKLRVIPVNAIIYVQINGRSDDMLELQKCIRSRLLIEDACQAFGSMDQGQYMGTFGDIGVYSLSPHKIITTGQGGVIVTNKEEVHAEVLKIRDFGREKGGVDWHPNLGFNFKYTDLQAVIGKSQLADIESRTMKKKYIFSRIAAALPKHFSMLPLRAGNVPWFVDILCSDQKTRDALALYLKGHGIGTRPFYPPLIDQPYLAKHGFDNTIEAKRFASRGLWLPSSLTITDAEIDHILETLHKF